MPTFQVFFDRILFANLVLVSLTAAHRLQFYWMGKMKHSFSGADERGIRSTIGGMALQAAKRGVFVNKEVTLANLKAFYATQVWASRSVLPCPALCASSRHL